MFAGEAIYGFLVWFGVAGDTNLFLYYLSKNEHTGHDYIENRFGNRMQIVTAISETINGCCV